MLTLSDAEKALVAAISEYRQRWPYGPSTADLCAMLGWKSKSTVHRHADRLVHKGVLRREPRVARSIRVCEEVEWI